MRVFYSRCSLPFRKSLRVTWGRSLIIRRVWRCTLSDNLWILSTYGDFCLRLSDNIPTFWRITTRYTGLASSTTFWPLQGTKVPDFIGWRVPLATWWAPPLQRLAQPPALLTPWMCSRRSLSRFWQHDYSWYYENDMYVVDYSPHQRLSVCCRRSEQSG